MSAIFRVAVRSRYAGADLVNVLHCQGSVSAFGDPATPTAAAVAAAVKAHFIPIYRTAIATPITVQDVRVARLSAGDEVEVALEDVNLAGLLAVSTTHLPREICMLLKLQTGHAGRHGRGRVFLPSPLDAGFMSDPDTFLGSGGYWTGAASIATDLVNGFVFTDDTAINWGVYSRADNALYDLTGVARDPRPHWLRSRMSAP